ncbi:MAG TPA: ABC transporter substrate-binding protein [Solirubrobacteraceae bacterium]|nr:ABC transporter substrate-binding protein [Solirubrobacteraceae bacterium]
MSKQFRRLVPGAAAAAAVATVALAVPAGSGAATDWSKATSAKAGGGFGALVAEAKKEGALNVIALPHNWANYGVELSTFKKLYPGIKITEINPSGSSADEITAIKQGKGRSTAPDVVDVGQSFTTPDITALFAPYKVQTWSAIPANAKDPKGLWFNDYGGYISFGCDMTVLKVCPTTWAQLKDPQYKNDVSLNGAIGQAAAATAAVYAAAVNNGGSAANVQPGIDFFNALKSNGNLNATDCNSAAVVEKHQCPILINWDYLNTVSAWGLPAKFKNQWKVVDPKGTAFGSYYVQAISKSAPHPAAARLWEEFLYSTQGQNIWLQGGARPVELPALVKAGKHDKKAYAALPKVAGTPVLPTASQSTAAGTKIAAAFPA